LNGTTVNGLPIGGTISQVSPTGNYVINFSTKGIPTNQNYLVIITVVVSLNNDTYTYALPLDAHVYIQKYQPTVIVPATVPPVTEGGTASITISVTDPTFGGTFDAIEIDWMVNATTVDGNPLSGKITQVNASGNYTITFSVADLVPNANYVLVITVYVTDNNMTYTYANKPTVVINVGYQTILGIPRPYFWMLVIGIAAVVGFLSVYRYVAWVRIPLFVKHIMRARGIIRKGLGAPREPIAESRQETVSKLVRDRYAAIGVDPMEKFGGKTKGNEKQTAERNPEGEVID
jgi:hypothetical protein